jgi:hypothetical protein
MIPTVGKDTHRFGLGLLRGVLYINFVLFALLFTECFLGNNHRPGVLDWLFGAIRLGGFRADVVWVIVSSIAIFFSMFFSSKRFRVDRYSKENMFLCRAWLVAFFFYIALVLFNFM